MKFTPRTVVPGIGLILLLLVGCQTYRQPPMQMGSYPGPVYQSQPMVIGPGGISPGGISQGGFPQGGIIHQGGGMQPGPGFGQPTPVYGQPSYGPPGGQNPMIGQPPLGTPRLGQPDLGPSTDLNSKTPTYNPPAYDSPGYNPPVQTFDPSRSPVNPQDRVVPRYPDPGQSGGTYAPQDDFGSGNNFTPDANYPPAKTGQEKPVPTYPAEPFTPQPEPFEGQPAQPEPFSGQPAQPEPFAGQPAQPEPFAREPEPFAGDRKPAGGSEPEPFAREPEPFLPNPQPKNPATREFPGPASGPASGAKQPDPFGDGQPFQDDQNPPPFDSSRRETQPSVPIDGSGQELHQVSHEQPQSFGGQNTFGNQVASFEQPTTFEGSGNPKSAGSIGRPNPYGYDAQNYTWLRGIVDYDTADKSWYIIYDLTPTAEDQFGGGMTLTGEGLNALKNGQVVLVQGIVDFNTRDRTGKACYHVRHLAVLRAPAR